MKTSAATKQNKLTKSKVSRDEMLRYLTRFKLKKKQIKYKPRTYANMKGLNSLRAKTTIKPTEKKPILTERVKARLNCNLNDLLQNNSNSYIKKRRPQESFINLQVKTNPVRNENGKKEQRIENNANTIEINDEFQLHTDKSETLFQWNFNDNAMDDFFTFLQPAENAYQTEQNQRKYATPLSNFNTHRSRRQRYFEEKTPNEYANSLKSFSPYSSHSPFLNDPFNDCTNVNSKVAIKPAKSTQNTQRMAANLIDENIDFKFLNDSPRLKNNVGFDDAAFDIYKTLSPAPTRRSKFSAHKSFDSQYKQKMAVNSADNSVNFQFLNDSPQLIDDGKIGDVDDKPFVMFKTPSPAPTTRNKINEDKSWTFDTIQNSIRGGHGSRAPSLSCIPNKFFFNQKMNFQKLPSDHSSSSSSDFTGTSYSSYLSANREPNQLNHMQSNRRLIPKSVTRKSCIQFSRGPGQTPFYEQVVYETFRNKSNNSY